ncbi:hypothetical protein MRX96_009293 [Rhipicephalus microplus]
MCIEARSLTSRLGVQPCSYIEAAGRLATRRQLRTLALPSAAGHARCVCTAAAAVRREDDSLTTAHTL